VAAALVLVVLAVVGWLVLGRDGDAATAQQPFPLRTPRPLPGLDGRSDEASHPSRPDLPDRLPRVPRLPVSAGTVTLERAYSLEFDTGKMRAEEGGDIALGLEFFPVQLEVQSEARMAYLGKMVKPELDTCSAAKPSTKPISEEDLAPGGVLCVFTGTGQTAVVTILDDEPTAPSHSIRLRYSLYATP
jgi:hypothetical protein